MAWSPNLNGLIGWEQLLPFLGVDVPDGLLPHAGPCPLCEGSLTTHKCTTGTGEWHSCRDCGFAGDNIELASAAWKMTPAEAIERLCRLLRKDAPGGVDTYTGLVLPQRQNTRKMWEVARNYFPRAGGECRGVRQRLGIPGDVPQVLWKNRGGQFVGGADRKTIELAAFGPDVAGGQKDRNLFKGKAFHLGSWKEGLVIPLFDLPGRISAMVVAASPPHSKLEIKYVSLMTLPWSTPKPGGVAMPEALNLPPTDGDDRVLVCLDPVEALKMHVRHFADNSNMLPLVGIWGPALTPVMLMQSSRNSRIVLRAEKPGADVFRHAWALDASVAFHDSKESPDDMLWRHQPPAMIRRQFKSSRPWAEALEEYLDTLSSVEADELFAKLSMSTAALDKFLSGCRPSTRVRLEGIADGAFRTRKLEYKTFTISATTGSWSHREKVHNNVGVITDAPFQLDRVVYQPRIDKSYYQGRVWYGGEPHVFVAEKDAFDKWPMLWLHHQLIERNIGVTSYNPRWHDDALNISLLLHKPELVRGVESYGWDPRRAAFVLPEFILTSGGRVEPNPDVHVPANTPGRGLRAPQALNAIDLLALEKSPLAWAMALVVLHNVLAPSCSVRPSATALVGDGVAEAVTLARALGCPDDTCRDSYENNWPVVIRDRVPTRLGFRRWLAAAPNCLVEVQDPDAASLGTYPHWTLVRTKRQPPVTADVLEAAAKVVPAFLHRVCLQRMNWGKYNPLWQRLVHEVNDWRHELGLPDLVQTARRMVRPASRPGAAAYNFADALVRLTDGEFIKVVNAKFMPERTLSRRTVPQLVYFDDKLWIPKLAVNQALLGRRTMPVDVGNVGKGLAEDGVLLEEVTFRGDDGWLVTDTWWRQRNLHYNNFIKNPSREDQ